MREFVRKIDWHIAITQQTLFESLMKYAYTDGDMNEFWRSNYWFLAIIYQRMPEDCMVAFADELGWSRISAYGDISKGFVEKYSNKVRFDLLPPS